MEPPPMAGWQKPPALCWRVGVERESSAVYHHMVMKPAQGRQIVGMVRPKFPTGPDVVRLEPRPRGASVGRACSAVPGKNPTTGSRRDGGCRTADCQRGPVRGAGRHLDDRLTKNPFRGVAGPTLGPDAIHAPDSPSVLAASVASTMTVVVTSCEPSPRQRAWSPSKRLAERGSG